MQFGKKGIARIEATIGKFDVVRQDLLAGIADCYAETEDNESTIKSLQTRNGNLRDAAKKAQSVVKNIGKILGEDDESA